MAAAASSNVTTAVVHTRVRGVALCVDEEASFALVEKQPETRKPSMVTAFSGGPRETLGCGV